MSDFKNFRSPGDEIRIASTSGHIATIGPEFVPVHSSLWREAYASGAVSEDMKGSDMNDYVAKKKKEKEEEEAAEYLHVLSSLKEIVNNPTGFLDANGVIIHRKAIALIGKPTKKDIVDKAWAEITSNLED